MAKDTGGVVWGNKNPKARPPKFVKIEKPTITLPDTGRFIKQHQIVTYQVSSAATVTDRKVRAWVRIPSNRFQVAMVLVNEATNNNGGNEDVDFDGSTNSQWNFYSAKENPDTGKINRLALVHAYDGTGSNVGFEYSGADEIIEVELNVNSSDFATSGWLAQNGRKVNIWLRVSWEPLETFCNDEELCRLFSRCELWGERYVVAVPSS